MVVVGAGVVGLLAAVECVLAGHRVTVLDRGPIPNPNATSWDDQRSVRALHPGDAAATHEAAAGLRRWLELQDVLGASFYREVGVLTGLPASQLDDAVALARTAGVSVRALSADALAERLPHLVFASGTGGVLETSAGVVLARRALAAAAQWLRATPLAVLRPDTAVSRVDCETATVELVDGSTLGADLLLVAAGPWSRELLAGQLDTPLVLYRQSVAYCAAPPELDAAWRATPAVGRFGPDGRGWLTPPGPGAHLKLSSAVVCREVDTTVDSPLEVRSRRTVEPRWQRRTESLLPQLLRGDSHYRVLGTRDYHYLADARTSGEVFTRLRSREAPVLAYAACGGGGFKTAPLTAMRTARWPH